MEPIRVSRESQNSGRQPEVKSESFGNFATDPAPEVQPTTRDGLPMATKNSRDVSAVSCFASKLAVNFK
jgi:hypothetical protein